ncbi:MAG: Xaa-Pro dipeptidase [Acidobacteria bacterium]|nr:Xaa-Pro dipeptidase [Acidobacteriota bacterium]
MTASAASAAPAQLYPAHLATLRERHDRALAEHGFDHLLIFAGAQRMIFLDDMPYPFKVNPHFKAWLPVLDNPHCFLVYTPGEKPRLVFYQPVDYWYKPAETPSGFWVGHFDIRIITTPEEAKEHFRSGGRTAMIGEAEETYGAELNPHELLTRLHFDRAWKTDYELECMREANRLGARGHRAAERAFREGKSEYDIHIDFVRAATHTEDELPYGTIIALNEHAAVLHYHFHDRQPLDAASRHSFLIDAGASYNGYASDITRTYSERPDEFRQLIDAMEEMQQSLCASIKPGVNYPDVHLSAHQKIAGILQRFGFVDLPAEGIVEKGISGTFLPHGVGHYIGLQVHDVGGFLADPHGMTIPKPEGHPYLRLTRVVEPRQSFTIEPGLYFIQSLLADLRKSDDAKYVNWDKVDAFRKFGGIRIEDDVVVTDSGHENLTRDAFAAIGS